MLLPKSQEGLSAHDPGWSATQARYAGRYNGKPMYAVRTKSNGTGFKTRAARLIGDGLNCRWSGRECAYIASPSKVARLEILYAEGWNASVMTGTLIMPKTRD